METSRADCVRCGAAMSRMTTNTATAAAVNHAVIPGAGAISAAPDHALTAGQPGVCINLTATAAPLQPRNAPAESEASSDQPPPLARADSPDPARS